MTWVELSNLGLVSVRGPDARAFLQGQLTNDLRALSDERSMPAAVANAQGRVVHFARLLTRDDQILIWLPRSETLPLREQLARYVLRAEVELQDDSDTWRVLGLMGGEERASLAAIAGTLPAHPGAVTHHREIIFVALDAGRVAVLGPRRAIDPLTAGLRGEPGPAGRWQLAEIRAGWPEIRLETRALFVPQMLNLDLLGAISFSKGCYTGQEVIARTQHLGRIKRRMLRARGAFDPPAPATPVLARGEVTGHVVRAEVDEHGACELLATVSLADRDEPLTLESGGRLERLSLPYPIPELDGAAPAA